MGDTTSLAPTLSDSAVLEVAIKIIIAVVIVLFVVIALVSLLHIYTRVFWLSSSYTSESPSIISWRRQQIQQQRGGAGLDKSTLDSLPFVSYDPDEFKEVGGFECAVCLCELQKGEKLRLLPKCNHGFHLDCIDMWFKSHSSCPICRDLVTVNDVVVVAAGSDSTQTVSDVDDNNLTPFPTNVLFWGDLTSGNVRLQDGQAAAVASTSNGNSVFVIDVPLPVEQCEDCSALSTPRIREEEGNKSPVEGKFRTLKRLLSRGKRVGPTTSIASPSSSHDVHEQV